MENLDLEFYNIRSEIQNYDLILDVLLKVDQNGSIVKVEAEVKVNLNLNQSEKDVEEFKRLYEMEYGIKLDDRTARYKAAKLLGLMRPIYKPIRMEDKDKYEHFSKERPIESKIKK
ncbi:MAG: hypothetical protein UU67_C0016G0016 [Candidatus Daviesbacteria bacterium GW2011_GWB1_41_5]|uniref:Uncharacterized protein n=1 Tax=Candidatus Daviesbacteria bacterium GW2011_GWB1_41_5 TaxID=1618429 RepID=A0A0G0ZLF5_9BACT|nr:MAG: hypothetical protein UU67_C0016G0016 [Candidatus Daviesbacteria bacterium GW2011_GWB1_41_5]